MRPCTRTRGAIPLLKGLREIKTWHPHARIVMLAGGDEMPAPAHPVHASDPFVALYVPARRHPLVETEWLRERASERVCV